VVAAAEIRRRAGQAEYAWAAGNWPGAFQAYSELFRAIVDAGANNGQFAYNEFLVMDRYANLAVPLGRIEMALDLYHALHLMESAAPEARVLAACKRLQIAVEAGDSVAAQDALGWIVDKLWEGRLPEATLLDRWEATVRWPQEESAATMVQMYLALGRLYNALRRLTESSMFLERGLRLASGSLRARLGATPIHLALANNHLCLGDFAACEESLRRARALAEAEQSAQMYGIWLDAATARLDLMRGRLANTLEALARIELACRERGLVRALCNCLLSRAEVFILLNLLPESDACLEEAMALARDEGIREIEADAARVRFFRLSRARLFGALEPGTPVWDMQNGTEPDPVPRVRESGLRRDAVVWTGDCLRDYELREALVYAGLDESVRKSADVRTTDEVREDAVNLDSDFNGVDSPLIHARLRLVRGLFLGSRGAEGSARPELEEACALFATIGAKRELYQATVHLARAIETTDRERYAALLADNEKRLNVLSEGLSIEQRNAFELNKYTLAQEIRRVEMERIVALRRGAMEAAGWKRWFRKLHYWRALHEFIRQMDAEQQRRRKAGLEAPVRWSSAGFPGLLRRVWFHPNRNQTVGYIVLPDRTFLFSLRRWHLDCRILEIGRPRIAAQVRELHRCLAAFSQTPAYEILAQATCDGLGLREILGPLPERIDSLTIVPDAELSLVPFCALRLVNGDGSAGYVVERFAVNMDDVSSHRVPPVNGQPVALAARYSGESQKLECAATATANASDWIEKTWGIPCENVDEKAKCLSTLKDAAIFYYFGHGYFKDGDPDGTGIEFRGCQGTEILSIRDLDLVDFSRLDQAVILACHGADARVLAGRWTVSLPEILIRRGARSVLGAVWQPEEGIAKKVSDGFFGRAATVGRAMALRAIQIDLLRDRPSGDPFDWAPFQVYGEAGVLNNPRRTSIWRKWRRS
jgi:hypothetical protein